MSLLQNFFDFMIGFPVRGRVSKLAFQVIQKAYFSLPKPARETIQYSLNGITLELNAGHRLPLARKLYPDESMSIGRVAVAVSGKYPHDTFIDIGANVGDTAAIIRSHGVGNRLICIEGIDPFFRILERNALLLNDVVPLKAFVGPENLSVVGHLHVLSSGNAVVLDKPELYRGALPTNPENIEFRSLPNLLRGHLRKGRIKLIKTDIEGFDMPVLNANLELLAEHLPAVFFEMHVSDSDERVRKTGWKDLFGNLKTLGYSTVFYWINSRDYLCRIPLSCWDTLSDVNEYFRNRRGEIYADVCAIHSDDSDLIEIVHSNEIRHAGASRTTRP